MAQLLCSASFYLVACCPLLSVVVPQLVWGLWSGFDLGFRVSGRWAFKGWHTVIATVIHLFVSSVFETFQKWLDTFTEAVHKKDMKIAQILLYVVPIATVSRGFLAFPYKAVKFRDL